MNVITAMKLLLKGKSVRRKLWREDMYLVYDDERGSERTMMASKFQRYGQSMHGSGESLGLLDVLANDWEEMK